MTVHDYKSIYLFPLSTVLFPGGLLPLKIFEQRYLEMTKICLRDNLSFGVCLIREGAEVGSPAVPVDVGCLASIEQWSMPTPGMFHLLARGSERFRIHQTLVAANGLLSGKVEILAQAQPCVPDADCVELVRRVIDQVGAQNFSQPICLEDSVWVAYRLAEMMNLPGPMRQKVLLTDAARDIYSELSALIKSRS